MQTTLNLSIAVLILPALLLVAGIVLTVRGLRGRRVDDHPHCRKCGFDLIGLPEGVNRCSECGADLTRPRAIREGRRQRRPVALVFGLSALLFVLGGIGLVAWSQIRNLDEYRVMPAWYLLRQARYDGAAPPLPAWNELLRRLRADELSKDHTARAAEMALAIQQDRSKTWNTVFGDFLELSRDQQQLTDAQWQRYARQAPSLWMDLRAKVRRGDNLPARIREGGARVGSNTRLYVQLQNGAAEGDLIKPIDPKRHGGYTGMGLSSGSGGWSGQTIDLDPKAAATAPLGVCEVTLRSRLVVREGWEDKSPVLAEWDEQMTATWELVEADAETVELIEDESHRAAVEKGTTIQSLKMKSSTHGDHVSLNMAFNAIPIPLAHDVVLRAVDGREWKLSSITLLPGNMGYGTGGQAKDLDVDTVDVIFRPSPAAARNTVHVNGVWNHEFVIPKVTVERPAPSTQPATAPAKGGM
jgi:predicted nucleic acid-binding Zn ribbon protein